MEYGQSLACCSSAVVKFFTGSELGEGTKDRNLGSATSQLFGRFRKRSNYKDNGIRLLLLSSVNALNKDN